MISQIMLIYWTFSYALILTILTTPTLCHKQHPICPEWCDCMPSTENADHQSYHLICEWPHIPDAEIFRTFPVETVSRLSITCSSGGKMIAAKSKYTAGMFEKFVKLRQLSIDNCDSSTDKLPSAFGKGLSRLQALQLHNSSIKSADIGALANLNQLEKLTLTYSSLTDLPSGELCSLPDLKYLNLSGNEFITLGNVGISECQNLKIKQIFILDMSNNKISRISSSNLLTNFPALRILRLATNTLREIPSKLFDDSHQLQELYLENNRISSLNSLPTNLLVLDLSNNSLHLIPPHLSQHSTLQRLNLSQNFIDSNSPFSLQNLNQLTSLDLSYNRLQNAKVIAFTNSTNLVDVRLNDNEIRHLELRAFRNSAHLKTLNLANNRLSSLTRQHLEGLSELVDLNLHNNSLSSLDNDVFAPVLNLNSLRISNNILLETPAALYVLSKLTSLDISHNRISKLRKFVLDKLTSLIELNLANNKLTNLEKSIFEKMTNLKRLDLSSNSLKVLEMNFLNGLKSLEVLYLQQNLLTAIDSGLFSTSNSTLRILNISENRISTLNFVSLPRSLIRLSASNNQIEHATGGGESRNLNLRFVDLSYNKLTSLVPYVLPSTTEYANFSNNQITEIEDNAFNNTSNLTSLDLRSNLLVEIDESNLEIKGSIFLSDNPLLCSCRTKWMKNSAGPTNTQSSLTNSAATNSLQIADYSKLMCSTLLAPSFIKPLGDIPPGDFLCSYKTLCIDTCMCCDYDACDCNNICPDGCQCYNDVQNSLNFVKCSNMSQLAYFGSMPMYATSIFLDGSDIGQLERNSFFGRYRLKRLYLNSSRIHSLRPNAFSGVTSLEFVDLSGNSLIEFRGDEFFNTPRVEALLLHNNRLKTLHQQAFENLPNLKRLTLNDNDMQILPAALLTATVPFEAISLANNPWKCDCDSSKYNMQIWLPSHKNVVVDQEAIYCYENLTDSENSTVLSLLPPTVGQVVKVNFWTFVNEINKTLCYPPVSIELASSTKYDNVSDGLQIYDSQVISNTVLILIAVSASGLILLILLTFVLWKCHKIVQQKSLYNKYTAAASDRSSSNTAPGASNCNSPVPLLQYKTFISYSKQDSNFVINELMPRLEQQNNYPYYVCLLHRDFEILNPHSNSNSDSPPGDEQRLTNDIIGAMERSARVITVISSNFIKNEWTYPNIRPAYQYLLRYKHSKVVMIVLDDRLPKKLDSMLDHYLRTNRCIFYNDPLFWHKLTEALPSDNNSSVLNDSSSSNYAELYGTIVPSRFV